MCVLPRTIEKALVVPELCVFAQMAARGELFGGELMGVSYRGGWEFARNPKTSVGVIYPVDPFVLTTDRKAEFHHSISERVGDLMNQHIPSKHVTVKHALRDLVEQATAGHRTLVLPPFFSVAHYRTIAGNFLEQQSVRDLNDRGITYFTMRGGHAGIDQQIASKRIMWNIEGIPHNFAATLWTPPGYEWYTGEEGIKVTDASVHITMQDPRNTDRVSRNGFFTRDSLLIDSPQ